MCFKDLALSTLRRRNFKTQTITGNFGFLFKENSGREITWLSRRHGFLKKRFSKRFPSTRKRKKPAVSARKKKLRFQISST